MAQSNVEQSAAALRQFKASFAEFARFDTAANVGLIADYIKKEGLDPTLPDVWEISFLALKDLSAENGGLVPNPNFVFR